MIYRGARRACRIVENIFRPERNIGWNKAIGGGGGTSKPGRCGWNKGLTKETDPRIASQAEKMRGTRGPYSEERKAKLRKPKSNTKNMKGRSGIHMFGRKQSEETKMKKSAALKGRVPWNKGKTGVQDYSFWRTKKRGKH